MAISETKQWYTRSGYPFVEITRENPGGHVISVSNPMQGGDVVITEVQYNNLIADAENAAQATRADIEAILATRQADFTSASAKLLALGLTQTEINALRH